MKPATKTKERIYSYNMNTNELTKGIKPTPAPHDVALADSPQWLKAHAKQYKGETRASLELCATRLEATQTALRICRNALFIENEDKHGYAIDEADAALGLGWCVHTEKPTLASVDLLRAAVIVRDHACAGPKGEFAETWCLANRLAGHAGHVELTEIINRAVLNSEGTP